MATTQIDTSWVAQIAHEAAALSGTSGADVSVTPIPYDMGSPGTGGLWSVEAGEQRWFVKVLQHPRWWPGLSMVPENFRQEFLDMFPWRAELEMHLCGLGEVMPTGLRTAQLMRFDEPDLDHIILWVEWIDIDESSWQQRDFDLCARRLGQLAARRRAGAAVNDRLPDSCHAGAGTALRYYTERRVLQGIGAEIGDDDLWRHPLMTEALQVAGTDGLRERMDVLLGRLPALLDALDTLPQAFPHGDASPQNLPRAVNSPSEFVVIDWGFDSLHAVGMDLSQLVVGLAHADLLEPERIPSLLERAVDAYAAGLAAEGWKQPRSVVRRGALATLACRSALTAIPTHLLGEPVVDATVRQVANRMGLTDVLLDLAWEVA